MVISRTVIANSLLLLVALGYDVFALFHGDPIVAVSFLVGGTLAELVVMWILVNVIPKAFKEIYKPRLLWATCISALFTAPLFPVLSIYIANRYFIGLQPLLILLSALLIFSIGTLFFAGMGKIRFRWALLLSFVIKVISFGASMGTLIVGAAFLFSTISH
ncbi:MAG: hypothetical protein WC045_01910 [Patescibacteria group bacterium]